MGLWWEMEPRPRSAREILAKIITEKIEELKLIADEAHPPYGVHPHKFQEKSSNPGICIDCGWIHPYSDSEEAMTRRAQAESDLAELTRFFQETRTIPESTAVEVLEQIGYDGDLELKVLKGYFQLYPPYSNEMWDALGRFFLYARQG